MHSGLFWQAGQVQIAEISARWGELDDFLDDEFIPVDFDALADFRFFVEVKDRTRMAAVSHHDADFVDNHFATLG